MNKIPLLLQNINSHFPKREDMYAQDSIELLKRSGIDFAKNQEHGIDVNEFGELLMTSGVVLDDNVKWIRFVLFYYYNGSENYSHYFNQLPLSAFIVDMILHTY